MRRVIHLCDFASPPTIAHECYRAIWSQGSACKACAVGCYRRGWRKWQVAADNVARVRRKGMVKA